jgi:hypothetical protein
MTTASLNNCAKYRSRPGQAFWSCQKWCFSHWEAGPFVNGTPSEFGTCEGEKKGCKGRSCSSALRETEACRWHCVFWMWKSDKFNFILSLSSRKWRQRE